MSSPTIGAPLATVPASAAATHRVMRQAGPRFQAPRIQSTGEIRMYCMTAPWGPVVSNASPRRAMRLADLLLLIVADRLWVADRAGSLAIWPPDAISAGGGAGEDAGEGVSLCTPLNRSAWPGGRRVALGAPRSETPNYEGGGRREATTVPERLGSVCAPPAGTGTATRIARRTPTSRGRLHAPVVGTIIFPLFFFRPTTGPVDHGRRCS